MRSICLCVHRQVEEMTRGFDERGLLGEGGFGPVYKGTLRTRGGRNISVAVKELKLGGHQVSRSLALRLWDSMFFWVAFTLHSRSNFMMAGRFSRCYCGSAEVSYPSLSHPSPVPSPAPLPPPLLRRPQLPWSLPL